MLPVLQLLLLLLPTLSTAAAAAPETGVIQFIRIWTSADSATHIKRCEVPRLEESGDFGTIQYVRNLANSSVTPFNLVLTQQTGDNPWHPSPNTQFVVTLSGAWFVNTTDGDYVEMFAGDLLFQDDYAGSPLGGVHYSGTLGGEACNQLVIAVEQSSSEIPADLCDW